jgi:hypothetical protein
LSYTRYGTLCWKEEQKKKKNTQKGVRKHDGAAGITGFCQLKKKIKIKKMSIEAAKMSRRNYCINIRALALLSPHPTHFFFFFSVLRVFDRDVNQKQ